MFHIDKSDIEWRGEKIKVIQVWLECERCGEFFPERYDSHPCESLMNAWKEAFANMPDSNAIIEGINVS